MAVVAADVREPEQVDAVITATVARFGRLDVLVNKRGRLASGRHGDGLAAVHGRDHCAQSRCGVVFAQRANAVMQTQAGGGNDREHRQREWCAAIAEHVAYGAAKAGLLNTTRTLAVELAPKVRVTRWWSGWS